MEDELQRSRSPAATPEPSTPPLWPSGMRVASEFTTSPPRRSGRHVVGADGASATDEDSMQRAMRRTASRNLDFDGNSYMLAMAPYVVYPAEAGGQRPFYDGFYPVGVLGQGHFLPPWMAV
ncbi:uncharacterized protein LOC119330565 [Triticum dicoccoides]|uniref:uncharacterized protein LOC119330565 n=1 Tax=Triticum dicoccoides TaxID=85692 RepID=UPI00189044BF|nr:uncharacterized protein LOC119330565 [Triticum dicoccoides]